MPGLPIPRLLMTLALLLGQAAACAQAPDFYRLPLRWLNEDSRPQSLESLRGHATVLTLAYGACRRICSTSVRVLEQVQALADERGIALEFVIIGLDPSQDRPRDWAAFREERHLTRGNWHFLWGDVVATRTLARHLGVKVWRIDEHLIHDFKIVLLSPQGQVIRVMDRFDQAPGTLLP